VCFEEVDKFILSFNSVEAVFDPNMYETIWLQKKKKKGTGRKFPMQNKFENVSPSIRG
jgi:hypothetical protein